MAGIYLHIPFCKQACSYCNFHFSTSVQNKPAMVEALNKELQLRHQELRVDQIDTIYLGGGTPSLLTVAELEQLLATIGNLWTISPTAEITLEANPDDLSRDKLAGLRQTPVNRLSIGIQSFAAEDLAFMHRAHTATEADRCLENALAAGFEHLTVDLIYGAPTTTDAQWLANLDRVFAYGITHLSSYALTVEPRTALAHQIKQGVLPPLDEERAARQFTLLQAATKQHGYEQYEISNFARPGHYARHNTAYWQGKPYLGIGPAAHSYDGQSRRRWNVANNARYIRALTTGDDSPHTEEILTPNDRYNEYVMTALRTQWGVDTVKLKNMGKHYYDYFIKEVTQLVDEKKIKQKESYFQLVPTARFLADGIAASLFWID